MLSWLHIGDLHIAHAGEQNYQDLQRIVALTNGLPADSLDFVLLPGDNADDGTEEQFALIRRVLAPVRLKLRILPGDHDFKPRSLDAFYRILEAERLPYAITAQGYRCLFLDVVSAGAGGPDFRLGEAQFDWVERELDHAEAAVVFMHTYPADLREGAERLGALLGRPCVRCVDMGHTHYNELANDGGTIFMATRSTGQIEEGPPGFSIAAVDGGCVSWRFKPLDQAWPFVPVTQPADRRLVTPSNQTIDGALLARAKVVGDAPIEIVEMSVDDGDWVPMQPVPEQKAVWQAHTTKVGKSVRIRARDTVGRWDEDRVEPEASNGAQGPEASNGAQGPEASNGAQGPEASSGAQGPEASNRARHPRIADGSDRNRVGAWPEKGIPGTQLGPNRNGRTW